MTSEDRFRTGYGNPADPFLEAVLEGDCPCAQSLLRDLLYRLGDNDE